MQDGQPEESCSEIEAVAKSGWAARSCSRAAVTFSWKARAPQYRYSSSPATVVTMVVVNTALVPDADACSVSTV